MELLSGQGFESKTVSEFWNYTPLRHSTKAVVLSFDDGRASDYAIAFPILLNAGMKATFFLNSATVDTPGFLNWQQVTEMRRFGMSFESHSHQHFYLSRISKQQMEAQLSVSKRSIEDRIGSAVCFVAAPYGDVNHSVVESACDIGYSAVCTSHNWPAKAGLRTMARIAVYGSSTIGIFRRLVACDPLLLSARVAREICMYAAKETLFAIRDPMRRKKVEYL
jgi:peptidoglycan/xylan/chitin deacetylase (PgdA/CDA1 family)